ncbi:hypothetical protein VIGAN_11097700 [Vigna angularis var. angularis]|uniref:Uncharacterized protein n=1 Tax=Vigna angularis var. angularis TaxID=157739 RepID=A0A0S3TA55_PHAAN|nr:hypothetical protein VIGAN_11097700 [Vigna angularis var. angularis]
MANILRLVMYNIHAATIQLHDPINLLKPKVKITVRICAKTVAELDSNSGETSDRNCIGGSMNPTIDQTWRRTSASDVSKSGVYCFAAVLFLLPQF